jgi:prepilin-type N-terminal cleavage/methylation domain-containing protein
MSFKRSAGFTIVEMLIVIVVVAILTSLIGVAAGDSRKRARDTERVTDIDTLYSRLEEFRNDYGGYPNTFTASTFPSLNPEVLKDPSGQSIVINSPVANQFAAQAVANPTAGGASYIYTPYPTGCTAITCTGYVLKSYIESPSPNTPNPYEKTGLSNN